MQLNERGLAKLLGFNLKISSGLNEEWAIFKLDKKQTKRVNLL